MEIVPGIHKIDGVRFVNSYLVVNSGGMFLVDTGMPGNGPKIIRYIQKLGRKPSDIKYIFLTHADIDHVGSAAQLKTSIGSKLAIHAADSRVLAGQERFKPYKGSLPVKWAAALWVRLAFHPIKPDLILNDGFVFEGWRIIHTPGHTLGSVCIYQPGRAIFVGDTLRVDDQGEPRLISRKISIDQEQARKSASCISTLDFDVLLPGHGLPIITNAAQKIRNMLTTRT